MDRFAFLAGLPRTGSTVLGTLLSQHPSLHSTRTSCLRDMIEYVAKFRLGESAYFDLSDPNSQAWGIMRGMLYGAYSNVNAEIIIEKNRGWAGEIQLLRKITGEEPRILSPVRNIPEIISSFILISEKIEKISKSSKISEELKNAKREKNFFSLSRVIFEKYIYANWRVFKSGYEYAPECFLLIEYDDIVERPKETMSLICTYLDVIQWAPSTTGLKNPSPENDAIYGMPGLHTVKPVLQRTSPPAWEVLGDEVYEFWSSKNLEFWK